MIIEQVYHALLNLRAKGVTMLIVEESTDRALEMADRIYFMQSGRIVHSGRSEDLKSRGGLKDAYFGERVKSENAQ